MTKEHWNEARTETAAATVPTTCVLVRSKRQAVCRVCGRPLTWYETYDTRPRPVPFDGDPAYLEITRSVDGRDEVAFVDRRHRHSQACRVQQRRRQRSA